jgi:hypothetical protein
VTGAHLSGSYVYMSDTEPRSLTESGNLLAALAQMPSDPTGAETFARYFWQAKQAVRQWLTCLSSVTAPAFVVCERVEDTVLVYPAKLRFVQLKTRDRGSWSALGMCDEGLDSLAKTYSGPLSRPATRRDVLIDAKRYSPANGTFTSL